MNKQIFKQSLRTKGFTLIELLVVISIIGLLSSLAVVSLNNARAKARDAMRKADTAQIRVALGLYYDDNNQYPACGTWKDNEDDFGATVNDGSECYNGVLTAGLTGGTKPYMANMPHDPSNETNNKTTSSKYLYRYVSTSSGDQFAIVFETENIEEDIKVIRGW